MFFTFLRHQWLSVRRSKLWQKTIAVNILIGFFILYMMVNFLALGFLMQPLLEEIFPGEDPIRIFNSGLLFYFGLDLVIRFFMQDVPVMSIEPYLHLPVRKTSLIRYVLLRSLASIFNILPLFLLLPFTFRVVAPTYGDLAAFSWLLSIIMLILFDNFFMLYLKKLIVDKPWVVILVAAIIALLIAGQNLGIFDAASYSAGIFGSFIASPILIFVPLLLLALSYYLNERYISRHLYPEEIGSRKIGSQQVSTADLAFLRRMGKMGELLSAEIKLIWRHKRTRNILVISVLFELYGLVFYQNSKLNSSGMILLPGILITGIFLLSYGQFLMSWFGKYFDAILTNYIDLQSWLLSRYYLLSAACILSFLLSLPYGLLSRHYVFVNFACLLYNVGVNSFLLIFFSMLNPKKVDLNKRAAMNYQGVSAAQFVAGLPVIIIPILIYLPLEIFWNQRAAVIGLGLVGLCGILFHRYFIKKLAEMLHEKKYKLSEGFRESEG
jgi:hypothetical protein